MVGLYNAIVNYDKSNLLEKSIEQELDKQGAPNAQANCPDTITVKELAEIIGRYSGPMIVLPYSTVGLKAGVDFMLWRIGFDIAENVGTTFWFEVAAIGVVGRALELARDLAGAVDFLQGHDSVRGHGLAVVGFCMGGGLALWLATLRPDAVRAVVPFYGIAPEGAHPEWSALTSAVEGHFATHDDMNSPEAIATLETTLTDLGKEVRIDDEAFKVIGVAPRVLEAFDARMKFVAPLSWPPAAENPQGRYGVVEAQVVDEVARFTIEGSLDPLLKSLATYEVVDIVSHEADLEDTFLSYYSGDIDA